MPGVVQALSNRLTLTVGGRRLRAYSVVVHRGRRSGSELVNPVPAYPFGDGYVIPVLYGIQAQWVRNVLASNGFALRTRNETVQLREPRLLPAADVLPQLPPVAGRLMRLQSVHEFVYARRMVAPADS
jgi:hypothetical protein